MPQEIILTAPRTLSFRDYDEPDLKPGQVRVQSLLTGIKSGTEMALYQGSTPFASLTFDSEGTRMFGPRDPEKPFYPQRPGSWGVGKIVEVGEGAGRFRKGERVHGPFGHRPTHAISEERLFPMGDLSPEAALLTDPAMFALAIVHDAEIKVGDRVAIFGMGAIGLLMVQVAKLQGARTVIAVDRLNNRLEAARKFGADELLNPAHGDPGAVIKGLTGGKGVDVAIEISGSTYALHECIRCVHMAGLVVAGAYYQGDAVGLRLGEEWHHNRPTLKSSMAVWGCPHRSYPMWDEERLMETSIHLLSSGKLNTDGIVTHRFPFEQTPHAYDLIDRHPEQVIKAAITYPQ
ncbi:MAG: zinc-binding dehydrogenase [Armatimonadetes bacterium]|nr:zinc-binding dehydrogenase [Armatimonadota bacterium]